MGDSQRATSFGAAAPAYEQGRPDYLEAHVAWLLEGVNGPVLDLAAGTGKLTRVIAGLGYEVIAVDPDEQMLAHNTGVPAMVGQAEKIPLPDACVAAVTVGQAWHWFDSERAAIEIARVLRPGGRLGVIWNTRDSSDPFVAALAEVVERSEAETAIEDDEIGRLDGFTPFMRVTSRRGWLITPAVLEAMVTSRSHYLVSSAEQQQRTLAEVRELVAEHPHTQGKKQFEYQLYSDAFRADLVRGSAL